MPLQDVIDFYTDLTPETLPRLLALYSDQAVFKDPFNEVQGLQAIERIFRHMYTQVQEPRFVIMDRVGLT